MRAAILLFIVFLSYHGQSQYLIGIEAGPDLGRSSKQSVSGDVSLSFIYNPKYFCAKAGFGLNSTNEFGIVSRQFIYIGASTSAKTENFFVARLMVGYVNITPLDRKISFDGTKQLKSDNSSFSLNASLVYRIPEYRSLIGISFSMYTLGFEYLNKSHGSTTSLQRKIPLCLSYNYEF